MVFKIEFCKGLLFTEIILLLLCVIICLGEFRNDANTESLHLSNQGFRGIKVTKNYSLSNIFILLVRSCNIISSIYEQFLLYL